MSVDTFERLKAGMKPLAVTAINPGWADYQLAGGMAGAKAAAKFLAYAHRKRGKIDPAAAITYWAAAVDRSCDHMRRKGAIETNLVAWRAAFVTAMRDDLKAADSIVLSARILETLQKW